MKLLTTGVHAFFTCCIFVTLPAAGQVATNKAGLPNQSVSAIAVNDLEALAGAACPVTIRILIGANEFRISDMGGIGDPEYDAMQPAVAYNSTNNEYLVVWAGDDLTDGGLVDGEYEIFGQRLDATTGLEIGANDFRISEMGGTGDPEYDARWPTAAYAVASNQLLVIWWGDDNVDGLVNDEWEIFGQQLSVSAVFAEGFESGDSTAWSATVP